MILSNMIDLQFIRKLALSFEATSEAPHFEKSSFRFKKKIFATVSEKEERLVLKLSSEDQSVFTAFDSEIFFPVAGAWGKKGWTVVVMKRVRKDMAKDAITQAYLEVSTSKQTRR